MTNKKKKVVRDIQERTGWKYQFCLFINQQLGYEYVSKAVDDLEDKKETKDQLSKRLNKEAKAAQKLEAQQMAFVDGAESVGMGPGSTANRLLENLHHADLDDGDEHER